MTRAAIRTCSAAIAIGLFAGDVLAQPARPAVEAAYGGAWFLDNEAIGHHVGSAAAKWFLTPRLTLGPEITYMAGPGADRDLTLTGNVTWYVLGGSLSPYAIAGAGLFRHSDRIGPVPFSSTEGTFSMGGGIRVPIGPTWYVAPEARIGWEPHMRIQISFGYRKP